MFLLFVEAEDGIRDVAVTGVQTCALPILSQAEFVIGNVAVTGVQTCTLPISTWGQFFIAIGMARKNCPHVGATPQWTFAEKTTCGWKINANPTTTRSSCVPKSRTARRMVRRAASLIPTMFSSTRKTTTTVPPTMAHGFSRSGLQKIER